MERPRGERQPVERQLTAEMMYLHDRWRNGQQVASYAALPETAQRMYEEDAAALIRLGRAAAILEIYEKFDARSELSQSSEALANELLKFHGDYWDGCREDFEIDLPPHEVLTKIQALRIGEALAGDNEQLAAESAEEDSAAPGIRKQDALLTEVCLRVCKYAEDKKYAVTSEPGVQPQYPRDYLVYPSSETAYRYFMEVVFEYSHPSAEIIQETVGLYIGPTGNLSVKRDMFITGYSDETNESRYANTMTDVGDEDIAAFADTIAELVGDTPTPTDSRTDYDGLKSYIYSVPNGLARLYLREWHHNTSSSYVRRHLFARASGGSTLARSLSDPYDTDAQEALATLVNYDRQLHNEQARAAAQNGKTMPIWRDYVQR